MTIQQLSQEIGIGIDTLRIWERRYGFPVPKRDARGHRSYTLHQVEELRVVKKLQNFGKRPGKIFALNSQERRELLDSLKSFQFPADERFQMLIYTMSPHQIAAELSYQRSRMKLNGFIHQYIIPLLQILDHGWTTGQLSIARGHLVSDQLENLLKKELVKTSIGNIENRPQILFLTLSGERHKIGLLLSCVLFQQAGLEIIWLNEELPLSEIPVLATDLGVNGVALSFSSNYAPRQAKQDLRSLRKELDQKIKIIAGGHAVQQMNSLPNLLICTDLTQIPLLAQRHFKNQKSQETEK